jgi:RpiB/LacA/LacB family sugar-phosphate isomerase
MIALGSDHGGYGLKQEIIGYLEKKGIEYKDYGCYDESPCDYPVFGKKAAQAVVSGECEKGILICGTGIGISIARASARHYVMMYLVPKQPESIMMQICWLWEPVWLDRVWH